MSCPTNKDCNPFYTAYNANKRGLSLNLKSEDGKAILDKMLETADVFVSSYRTGALKRLGLNYDSLSKFPHLIWAQINGFGDSGPAKDNAGFDTVAFWARSGAMIDITEKDTSPVNPLIGFGDATSLLLPVRRNLRDPLSGQDPARAAGHGLPVRPGHLDSAGMSPPSMATSTPKPA